MTHTGPSASTCSFSFRSARPADGAALWRLVQATGTLELNSPYLYLLMATDFGGTCLLAEQDGEPAGLVIGYRPPSEPDAAFVWQIGVLPAYRGHGLGLAMLQAWQALPANRHARWVTATVDPDNAASQALFHAFAQRLGTTLKVQPHFTPEQFPVPHPAEPLLLIGPISRPQ
ncbi:diaminobutyrate acetyltransferase [Comamonas serinivorans]|uniref:L-2,4-diaminobutyric acid acetyltransferase n=1 Tax=Comamonas serinivorans TaxID=1082851 RepID=A0A1Y0EPH4_9BURK|nr:diaminobutyrate acetyltransferase [Comamonas serinivorans]ARU05533.1 diaminobutyrate acetyltransferase [Comamonas serinivorans]